MIELYELDGHYAWVAYNLLSCATMLINIALTES